MNQIASQMHRYQWVTPESCFTLVKFDNFLQILRAHHIVHLAHYYMVLG